MTEAGEKLKSALSAFSSEDRAELAHFLIGSLGPETDEDAEDAWIAELQRRFEDMQSGRVTGEPAAKVFAELQKKYQ